MIKKMVQMDEAVSAQASSPPEQPLTYARPGSGRRSDRHNTCTQNQNQIHRMRSMSLSLSWRRPKAGTQPHDIAVDDSEDAHDFSSRRSSGRGRAQSAASAFKGVIRRASSSLRDLVHRRLSIATETTVYEERITPARPKSSQTSCDSSRPSIAFARFHLSRDARHAHRREDASRSDVGFGPRSNLPTEYVMAPTAGAAAKASVALQNKSLRQPIPSGWLYSHDDHDRESGIGIVVLDPSPETSVSEGEPGLEDSSISRVDFVTRLPTELAIHVLAHLDAAALVKASSVSKGWQKVVANQHIWRESCLRETTATYATGGPIEPGSGLGVPRVVPSSDWKEIYRVKMELKQRWKEGLSRPVYLNGHTDSIYCLQFDEYKIISGSRDKTIRIWDMQTLECTLVIGPPEVVHQESLLEDAEKQAVHYASYPDHRKAVSSRPKVVSYAEHHKASILCLQYDEEILVTGSSDFTCLVYDVKQEYRPVRRLRHHSAAVLDLTFDKKHIVTCSKDISICVWDRETGTLLRQLRGHTGPVNAVQMRGNTIVSCSGDFRVKLWNIDTGKNIREFVGHSKGLACSQFSEDGRYVASAGNDKVIRIWDANTGECVREMKAHENLVRSLHIDSVSGRLVSGSYDTDIKVWDMETGHQLLDFPRWHASWVLSAKSDYRRIVSTGQDPKILIMDFGADVRGIEMLTSRGFEDEAGLKPGLKPV